MNTEPTQPAREPATAGLLIIVGLVGVVAGVGLWLSERENAIESGIAFIDDRAAVCMLLGSVLFLAGVILAAVDRAKRA